VPVQAAHSSRLSPAEIAATIEREWNESAGFKTLSIRLLLIAAATGSRAQVPSTEHPAEPGAAAESQEIPLDDRPTPVTCANEYATDVPQPGGVCGIRNVSRATLTPVLPNSGAGDGAAVSRQEVPSLACSLAIDLEGFRVAHALADHRVTAFVLKYVCILVQQRATTLTGSPRTWSINTLPIRTRAWPCNTGPRSRMAFERSPWSAETAVNRIVDPKRVGVIGFSAGALTARSTKRRF